MSENVLCPKNVMSFIISQYGTSNKQVLHEKSQSSTNSLNNTIIIGQQNEMTQNITVNNCTFSKLDANYFHGMLYFSLYSHFDVFDGYLGVFDDTPLSCALKVFKLALNSHRWQHLPFAQPTGGDTGTDTLTLGSHACSLCIVWIIAQQ